MPSDTKAIAFFTAGLTEQVKSSSKQNVHLLASSDMAINATLVGDVKAGTKQIAPEDAHPDILKRLRIEIAASLHKILSIEAKGIADRDYGDIKLFIEKLKLIADGNSTFMADAKSMLTESTGQLADVVNTNAVLMETGNSVRMLTGNDIATFRSLLWRGGTAMRLEAPLIIDNAHTRVLLAHSLLQEADLLTQRATNLLTTVADHIGLASKSVSVIANEKFHVSADTLELAAKTSVHVSSDGSVKITTNSDAILTSNGNVTIVGSRVDINPTLAPSVSNIDVQSFTDLPGKQSRLKKQLELPQWEGMSALPAFVSPEDETKLI